MPLVTRMSVPSTPYREAIGSERVGRGDLDDSPVTGGMRSVSPFLKSVFDFRLLAHTMVIGETLNLVAMSPSLSPFLTLYFWTRPLPSGTVVSTAIGLTSVPSSMNGPSTAAASVAEISVSPKSMAANGESGLVDLGRLAEFDAAGRQGRVRGAAGGQRVVVGSGRAVGSVGPTDVAGSATTDRDAGGRAGAVRTTGRPAAGWPAETLMTEAPTRIAGDRDGDRAIGPEAGDQGASVFCGSGDARDDDRGLDSTCRTMLADRGET